ncbi:carbonic anhydrase [Planctomycetota bacterium]|nr:carbonic anhydrase [Planctomycetota bacterium]
MPRDLLNTESTSSQLQNTAADTSTDRLLQNNKQYAQSRQHLPPSQVIEPSMQTAILTCMDCRIPIEDALGLKPGQAYIIRNAGNVVTDDVLRSLILAVEGKEVREILVIGHTDCALAKFDSNAFTNSLKNKYQCAPCVPTQFHAFPNIRKNIRTQVAKLKAHPYLAEATSIRGFIFDVNTGKINELVP